MLTETKTNTTTGTLPVGNTSIVISGFSWTPDAVLNLVVYIGATNDNVNEGLSLGSGKILSSNTVWIRDITFGSGTVTLSVRNQDSGTFYWESAIVTAAITN